MRDKLIETIRKILIKTVLPIRKKKQGFLGKLRFSISFRISLNYLRLFICNGLLFLLVFVFLYFGIEEQKLRRYSMNVVEKLETGELLKAIDKDKTKKGIVIYEYDNPENVHSYQEVEESGRIIEYREKLYHDFINPYYDNGLTMRLVEASGEEVIYEDIDLDISQDKKFLNSIYTSADHMDNQLVISKKIKATYNDQKYTFYFQYNLTKAKTTLVHLLPGLILILVFVFLLILKLGKKGTEKLLEPIGRMSATANRLTVNNLNSERLNIEGTQNELKDLAGTINNMLDRIETSYESQKQFVSDASHELRTPISVIQGYANLLDRWGKNDESVMEESIEAIKNESKAMQDLVEKLLFLSRHDKKTLKLEKTKFNMREVVSEMVKETSLVVKERNITSKAMEDVMVYGDKQALKQAVRVFIDNAVKYTKENDSIRISCFNVDGDCVIEVEDTGIGMTRKDVDNIFERFYRSNQVRNDKISGHGLGLSIAKLIVLKHTGKIKVKSQFSKGSTFTITLPRRQSKHISEWFQNENLTNY